MTKAIVLPKRDTGEILVETCTSLIDAITVLDPNSKATWLRSAPQLFKTLRGASQLYKVFSEWKTLRDANLIAGDYHDTEQHQDCLQELLESLDKESPESLRFDTLKKIFLIAATESNSDRSGLLPLQFMQVARGLSSAEILVLNSAYTWAKDRTKWEPRKQHFQHLYNWAMAMAEDSGLQYTELVLQQESKLTEKGLLSMRNLQAVTMQVEPHFRLSPFGMAFCEFVSAYDSLKIK